MMNDDMVLAHLVRGIWQLPFLRSRVICLASSALFNCVPIKDKGKESMTATLLTFLKSVQNLYEPSSFCPSITDEARRDTQLS